MPFWVIQALEITVALIFVDISVHVADGGLLIAAAIALFALAVTAQGPLGIFRICGPRLHLLLVTVTAAVVAVAPVVPTLRPDIEAIIVLEFGAVGLIRVATLTHTTAPVRAPSGRPRPGSPVIETTAVEVAASAAAAPAAPAASAPAASAPAASDAAASEADADATPQRGATGTGVAARWAGRMTGAASTSGKRVVAAYRPEAEAQVKRTIRGAGKLTGRVTSKVTPPGDPPPA
jgi:hypothetical protein